MERFKLFMLNENRAFLGRQVGDVLTDIQGIQDDSENLGTRHLARLIEKVVNDLRKILHNQWNPTEQKHLLQVQKIAVALMKTIDEKGDIKEVLPSAVQELSDLSGKLGQKVNRIEAPTVPGGEVIGQEDFEVTSPGDPNQQQPEQPQVPDAGMSPDMSGGMPMGDEMGMGADGGDMGGEMG